jgi:hypothetical protein
MLINCFGTSAGHELPIVIAKWKGTKVKRVYLNDICERLGMDD